MSQLEQDDSGDIKITNNRFTLVTGSVETRQRLKQNLKLFLGEWFLDINIGIAYHQIIFKKGAPPTIIEALYKSAILNTRGISGLRSFQPLNLIEDTRQLELEFEAVTPEGDVIDFDGAVP